MLSIATFALVLITAVSVVLVLVDRRAACVPHLTARYPADPQHRNPAQEEIEVVNVGRGPAVNCTYIGNMHGRWYRHDIFALRGQEERPGIARLQDGPKVAAVEDALLWGGTQVFHRVIVCEDTKGVHYGFSDQEHDRWPRHGWPGLRGERPGWCDLRP